MHIITVTPNLTRPKNETTPPLAESLKAAVCDACAFDPDSIQLPMFTLEGHRAVSLLGTMLGDIGGSTPEVPDTHARFDVQFSTYCINQAGEMKLAEVVVQTQCLPKDASLDARDTRILDVVCFGDIDLVGDINTPLDEDEVHDACEALLARDLAPVLGAVGWRVTLTPKKEG